PRALSADLHGPSASAPTPATDRISARRARGHRRKRQGSPSIQHHWRAAETDPRNAELAGADGSEIPPGHGDPRSPPDPRAEVSGRSQNPARVRPGTSDTTTPCEGSWLPGLRVGSIPTLPQQPLQLLEVGGLGEVGVEAGFEGAPAVLFL